MQKPTPIDKELIFEDGIMVSSMDENGMLTYVNKKFLEMTGYSKEELYGKHHSSLWHPDMPAIILKQLWEDLPAGIHWHAPVKYIRKNGEYFWLHLEFVTTVKDGITLYTAARRPLDENEKILMTKFYNDLREQETMREGGE